MFFFGLQRIKIMFSSPCAKNVSLRLPGLYKCGIGRRHFNNICVFDVVIKQIFFYHNLEYKKNYSNRHTSSKLQNYCFHINITHIRPFSNSKFNLYEA